MSCLKISEVGDSSRNHRIFRQIAREASGETYDAADGDHLVFVSVCNHGNDTITGVASYSVADVTATASNQKGHAHQLNYLFVHPRHQGNGHGTALLAAVEAAMSRRCAQRPIHVQSAYKAVQFFECHGYKRVGEPMNCICAGSRLFNRLQNMQKFISSK